MTSSFPCEFPITYKYSPIANRNNRPTSYWTFGHLDTWTVRLLDYWIIDSWTIGLPFVCLFLAFTFHFSLLTPPPASPSSTSSIHCLLLFHCQSSYVHCSRSRSLLSSHHEFDSHGYISGIFPYLSILDTVAPGFLFCSALISQTTNALSKTVFTPCFPLACYRSSKSAMALISLKPVPQLSPFFDFIIDRVIALKNAAKDANLFRLLV